MAHLVAKEFASWEDTHALVDRRTGKKLSEPVSGGTGQQHNLTQGWSSTTIVAVQSSTSRSGALTRVQLLRMQSMRALGAVAYAGLYIHR